MKLNAMEVAEETAKAAVAKRWARKEKMYAVQDRYGFFSPPQKAGAYFRPSAGAKKRASSDRLVKADLEVAKAEGWVDERGYRL